MCNVKLPTILCVTNQEHKQLMSWSVNNDSVEAGEQSQFYMRHKETVSFHIHYTVRACIKKAEHFTAEGWKYIYSLPKGLKSHSYPSALEIKSYQCFDYSANTMTNQDLSKCKFFYPWNKNNLSFGFGSFCIQNMAQAIHIDKKVVCLKKKRIAT